ncbi:MAG: DinB family protein [Candidatus Kariarchaeaceae archaeon]|jgi:hypothetical protein
MRQILLNQNDRGWKTLDQAIEVVPDDIFSTVINDWSFSFTVFHTIETAEFYARESPEGMKFGKRIGINWEQDSKEEIIEKKAKITKEDLTTYLGEIRKIVAEKINSLTDKEIFMQDGFRERFTSIYEKYVYLLRHTMYHIGELARSLRDNEEVKIEWQ